MVTMFDRDEHLARVDAAIADFEQRPDRSRFATLLEALYRQRAAIVSPDEFDRADDAGTAA